jgi:hypothetical protein
MRKICISIIGLALLFILISFLPSNADEKAGEQIKWQVLSGGGTNGSSTTYKLTGTIAQTAADKGTSTNYKLFHGFWQDFATSCCDKPGDASNNGTVNIQDITFLINYLYKGGPQPPCLDEGDANGSGITNIQDITYLINFLYKGGPAPKCV